MLDGLLPCDIVQWDYEVSSASWTSEEEAMMLRVLGTHPTERCTNIDRCVAVVAALPSKTVRETAARLRLLRVGQSLPFRCISLSNSSYDIAHHLFIIYSSHIIYSCTLASISFIHLFFVYLFAVACSFFLFFPSSLLFSSLFC